MTTCFDNGKKTKISHPSHSIIYRALNITLINNNLVLCAMKFQNKSFLLVNIINKQQSPRTSIISIHNSKRLWTSPSKGLPLDNQPPKWSQRCCGPHEEINFYFNFKFNAMLLCYKNLFIFYFQFLKYQPSLRLLLF